jgi:hypothetical protein
MKNKGLVIALTIAVATAGLAIAFPGHANDDQRHGDHRHGDQPKLHSGELVRVVRETTRQYRDVNQAVAAGYHLMFGCVSGPDDGAMGLHYVNLELVADGVLDPRRPEIVIYEPLPNGGRRLIGADFLIFAEAWHAKNTGTPELGGQLMHLIDSPNRYGLPAFYTLHVWAWKPNPTGAFVNWHSDVSCEQFYGQ